MKIKKLISNSLAVGLLLNSALPSLASILSEDGRYETFEGNNITIDNVLEEDKVEVEIEGNTMVNVTNQKDEIPITEGYTIEGTNHISLQGEYDGKAKPVIEGNTLVNLATGRLKISKVGDYGAIHYSTEILKADNITTYTVIIKNLPNDTRWCLTTHDQTTTYIGYNINNTAKFKSHNTYPSTISFIFNNSNISWTEDILNNLDIMVLEGDLTQNPPTEYFEGLKSSFGDQLVTQEMVDNGQEKPENLGKYKVEYKVTGKNKFNGKFIDGMISDNNGMLNGNYDTYKSSENYISVKPNTIYTINNDIADAIFAYDKNYNYLGCYFKDNTSISKSFTTFKDCEYIKLRYQPTIASNELFQLEEGSIMTEYEPYQESVKTFYLNSPLLEGDTIEDVYGKATYLKRYTKVVLDGSEPWITQGDGIFRLHLNSHSEYADILFPNADSINVYSDKFPSISRYDIWYNRNIGISNIRSGIEEGYYSYGIGIVHYDTAITTVDNFT